VGVNNKKNRKSGKAPACRQLPCTHKIDYICWMKKEPNPQYFVPDYEGMLPDKRLEKG
jgi:hypothetical protein